MSIDYSMKVWLDDLRPAPDETWTVVKNSKQALILLQGMARSKEIEFDVISFDHDLGGQDTSRCVLNWMIENDYWPNLMLVHSQNPIGAEYLHGTGTRYAPERTKVRRLLLR